MNRKVFFNRYKELLGDGFEGLQDIQPESSPQYIRVNTLRISEEELIPRLKKAGIKTLKMPFLEHGYKITKAKFSPGASSEYLQGYYYMQEGASQLPPQFMELKVTDTVLDMAAAPGSKTTQMAQLMKNKGAIVALDISSGRLKALKNNLERCFVKNTIVYRKDARFCFDLGIEFDKILLDAPCSGNFAIDNNWFENKSQESINANAKVQKQLLKAALKSLKPKGILMYSTCSLEPEENELIIDWLLNKYDNIKIEEMDTIGDPGLTTVFDRELSPEISKCKRLWPHKTETQGFFMAKVRKTS